MQIDPLNNHQSPINGHGLSNCFIESKPNDNLLVQLNHIVDQLQKSNSGVCKDFIVDSSRKAFSNEFHQYRYNQKRLIARSFCHGGYGVQSLKEQIGKYAQILPINNQKYQIIVRGVITQAYRKIEKFISEDCQREIQRMKTPQEMEHIYSILLNYRAFLGEQLSQIFIDFIEIIYELANVVLLQKNVLKLYIAILTHYHQAISNRDMSSSFGDFNAFDLDETQQQQAHHQAWKGEHDGQLLRRYKQNQNFILIKQYFAQHYQTHKWFSIDTFIARFKQLVRVSLTKVQAYCRANKEIFLNFQLKEQQTNAIINSENTQGIRLELADAFLNEFRDTDKLKSIAIMIKDYLERKGHLELDRPFFPNAYFINPSKNKEIIYFIPPPNNNSPELQQQFQMLGNIQDEIMQGLEFLKMGNNFDNFSDMDAEQFQID